MKLLSKAIGTCIYCNKAIVAKNTYAKYCSNRCQAEYKFENETLSRVEAGLVCTPKTLRGYLIRTFGYQCSECKRTEWNDHPIPLDMDHRDGDHTNNFPANLRLLCLNCHGVTPTFKNKNKGNGRSARRQRYAEGKSW